STRPTKCSRRSSPNPISRRWSIGQNWSDMKKTCYLIASLFAVALFANASPDLTMQTRIRQEGFRNSKVMETAAGLMDQVGARLTGSANNKRADKTQKKSR